MAAPTKGLLSIAFSYPKFLNPFASNGFFEKQKRTCAQDSFRKDRLRDLWKKRNTKNRVMARLSQAHNALISFE
jgi:hypothetical protein